MQRREFLIHSATVLSLAQLVRQAAAATSRKKPRILLRSGWQTVNIGDIGHTPGVLRLLGEHVPEADVWFWPSSVDGGVKELLTKRFPALTIVDGPQHVAKALEECDFLLHGSGPALVAQKDVERWWKETGKPFGVYGITLSTPAPSTIEILSQSRFALFRDSVSLKLAKDNGCTSPIMEFCPDGAFAVDLRNDAAAVAFLKQHDLTPGKFLCVIPRLRYTPYWTIPGKKRPFDEKKHARNEEMKEHDHRPLREAITAVVRETPLKVLVCPEDQTQIKVGKELIIDLLPDDVKAKVVWRDRYWLTDEAVSTYVRSAGLFGLEMHSPIMCIGNGVPALVGRFSEQTSKGLMWRDIGLGDWLFDMDQPSDVERLTPTVLELARNPDAARAKAAKARKFVEKRQRETMDYVAKSVGVERGRKSAAAADAEPAPFDGKSLAGWTTLDGKPVEQGWEIVDGTIHRQPGGRAGHIITAQEFGDFRLSFEWKIAKRGNSGFKYRVRSYGGKVLGCEYQIYDDGGGKRQIKSKNSAGALYDLYEPNDAKDLRPPGEFNLAKIVVQGDRIEHWLNGQLIVEAQVGDDEWQRRIAESKFADVEDFARDERGKLMLTDHGSEVWYRNFIFEPLGESGSKQQAC